MAETIVETFVRRVWADKDMEAIHEYMDPQCVIHSSLGDFYGHESMKSIVQTWLHAFPDLVVNNTTVSCIGDRVEIHWKAKGTHRGEFKGIPATGKKVSYGGKTTYRLAGSKIAEYWAELDLQHILQQIR